MKLILLSNSGRQSHTLQVDNWKFAAMLLAGILSVACAGIFANKVVENKVAKHTQLALINEWKAERVGEQEVLQQAKTRIEHELSALTAKVAMLQARIMRLDALGEQLAMTAKLDNGEFDFSSPPALGGPALQNDGHSLAVPGAETDALIATTGQRDLSEAERELTLLIEQMERVIENRESQLSILDKQLAVKEIKSEWFVAGRPVKWGWMSSPFGSRNDPFTGKKAWHNGVDFAGKPGSDVIAVAGGVVSASEKRYGYGNMVEISHGNGFVTRYGHNEKNIVSIGDLVEKGQAIAKMGSTGRSTGPHVHFEIIRNGKPINPEHYIYRRASL